jgi:hypothetical protein
MRPSKKQRYILQMPEPCEQSWQAMVPTKKGKFCTQCSTEVIDFTQYTTDEILAYLKRTSKPVCGRVMNNQLAKPSEVMSSTIGSTTGKWLKKLLFMLIAKITSHTAMAGITNPIKHWQAAPSIVHNDTVPSGKSNKVPGKSPKQGDFLQTKSRKNIKGSGNYSPPKSRTDLATEPALEKDSSNMYQPQIIANPPFHSRELKFSPPNTVQTLLQGRVMGVPITPKKNHKKKRS